MMLPTNESLTIPSEFPLKEFESLSMKSILEILLFVRIRFLRDGQFEAKPDEIYLIWLLLKRRVVSLLI